MVRSRARQASNARRAIRKLPRARSLACSNAASSSQNARSRSYIKCRATFAGTDCFAEIGDEQRDRVVWHVRLVA